METTLNGEISNKSVYISVNNNTNWKFLKILSIYTIWVGLSQKTISRYCPFKRLLAIEELNTERPTLAFFLVPTKPLQAYG